MKTLIAIIMGLFILTVSADKTYDNELKRLEAIYSKAKLKAANAYLKRLHTSKLRAMKLGDLKKANAMQDAIAKLQKSYSAKEPAVAKTKPAEKVDPIEALVGVWQGPAEHIRFQEDGSCAHSNGVKGKWALTKDQLVIVWRNGNRYKCTTTGKKMTAVDKNGIKYKLAKK